MKRALGEVCIQVPLEPRGKNAYVWKSQKGFVKEVLRESLEGQEDGFPGYVGTRCERAWCVRELCISLVRTK